MEPTYDVFQIFGMIAAFFMLCPPTIIVLYIVGSLIYQTVTKIVEFFKKLFNFR